MAGSERSWTRADLARWFVEHDDVDEAARVLEPGDQLELGHSDALDLAAALARRGLTHALEGRRLSVLAPEAADSSPPGALTTGPRKPPLRAPSALPAATKKTA